MEIVDKIVMRPINTIKPYIRNPRKNDKTVDLLVQIIPKVGFNVPLVIDKNGIIVKGHSRFRAAIKLGMKELPCVITEADEETIKLDRIADNKISEFSEWVNDDLMHELDMLNIDFDLSTLGFDMPKFEEIPTFDEFELMEDEKGSDEVTQEQREKLYAEFLAKQEAERAKNGAESEKYDIPPATTEKAIERATERQREEAAPPPKYYKCVCEKCGHVMFVDANNVWEP